MVDVTTAFVKVTQPLISMCQAGINKETLLAGYTELKAAADALSAAMVAKGAPGGSPGEVQILGSLIGVGLSDTGTADSLNLLVSTQGDFAGLDWVSSAITPADTGQTDPFGGSTASTLTETSATSVHFHSQAFYTAASSAQYTYLFYIKQGLRTRALLVVRDLQAPSTNNAYCTFDLAGVQIGVAATITGAFTSASATITSESNGFVLCTLTFTTNGTGTYDVEIYPDAGSGTASSNTSYAGNTSAPALTIGGTGVYAGATGTYIPLNANSGAAASTIQQVFSPNGATTAYWGTQTPNAYPAFDAGVPVQWTRHQFAPEPSNFTSILVNGYTPDYALNIAGAVIQTDVADSTFASPTTVDTIPAVGSLPYYPRFWLSERSLTTAPSRYIRFKPPSTSFGGISAWQVFAKGGTSANACPVQPVITPNGGRFPSLSTTVKITSLTTTAKIYYTVGTVSSPPADPTTSSTLYTGPFTQAVTGQVLIKAIAYLASLSTPTSLVTTSAPFNGYGFTPNDNLYDQSGNLIEAHAGDWVWDPNTSAYYWVGQFMNVGSRNTPGESWNDPMVTPVVVLYKGVSLDPKDPLGVLNWVNLGPILTGAPVAGKTGSRYHILYNALNNNYVILCDPVVGSGQQSLYYASTSGSDITSGWSWNLTPIISNVFSDFSTFIDSDGVTAYIIWHNLSTATKIQQLNTSYTGVTGSALSLAGGASREAPVLWKYPNVNGGTYFIITSTLNAYNSTNGAFDLRYITNTGSTPTANSWSASPASGSSAWASDPNPGNYNGQPTAVVYLQGKTQPMILLDYWLGTGAGALGKNYGSRYIFQPFTMTSTTAQINKNASWDPSLLATSYTLNALTLSGSTFTQGSAQGTVIGTVQGLFPGSTLALTDSHSGAVQLVAGVIQVGATPPGSPTSFNISLQETDPLASNSPKTTVISITENAVGGSLSGSVATFTSNTPINLTSLAVSGVSDWAAWGYTTSASLSTKASAGNISALTQVGTHALAASNHASFPPAFQLTWSDGATSGTSVVSASGEAYVVNCVVASGAAAGQGMSFTVPADLTSRTLLVYVGIAYNSALVQGQLTATLSDGSAASYSDTTLTNNPGTQILAGTYTITYNAANAGAHLTITWENNNTTATFSQNVFIQAAVIE